MLDRSFQSSPACVRPVANSRSATLAARLICALTTQNDLLGDGGLVKNMSVAVQPQIVVTVGAGLTSYSSQEFLFHPHTIGHKRMSACPIHEDLGGETHGNRQS